MSGRARTLMVAAAVAVALATVPAVADANHPLRRGEAKHFFKVTVVRQYDGVDYFSRGPSCTRFSRYLFRCVAVFIYTDGWSECVRGPVRATGYRHHQWRARVRDC